MDMDKRKEMLKEVKVINVGLGVFAESLVEQKARMVQVDWRPAAGGDERLQKILNKLLG